MHANKNDEEKLILFLLRSFFRINFSRTLADCYISKRREGEANEGIIWPLGWKNNLFYRIQL